MPLFGLISIISLIRILLLLHYYIIITIKGGYYTIIIVSTVKRRINQTNHLYHVIISFMLLSNSF